ncbi:DUF1330 domain-containing protein [Burkholderia sp. Bp9143]|uniref:DUF1330 domain-containing protein n=1 Tax=Burkholderia sp. Bp9143 TaxID=2184574 RepID=UPI000F5B2ECA|nr:DUF1330 domain-containing protein [Burkholderia sp. Bp9143]RQR35450.1 DUF1330 domain-containing protein [Burkholderia sp. Bp9143]
MAKAYWIAHVEVFDAESYAIYAKGATESFEKYGGKPLARGGFTRHLEGQQRPRNVVIEFDSMETALACYNSPEYQAAKAHRDGKAVADLMIVEGIE